MNDACIMQSYSADTDEQARCHSMLNVTSRDLNSIDEALLDTILVEVQPQLLSLKGIQTPDPEKNDD